MSTPSSFRAKLSWCFYDWANTAFGTVIITFIYSVYFSRSIVGDETQGAALWSYAIGFSGLIIAILGPIFGAIADHSQQRKPWIFIFTLLCCIATAGLWLGTPTASTAQVIFILCCLGLANIGMEMGSIFYNAMLPSLSKPEQMGRLSGLAWACGYAGGLACLILSLFSLVGLGDIKPLLSLPQDQAEHIRAVAPLTALWFFVFSLPLFLMVPEKNQKQAKQPLADIIKNGCQSLLDLIKTLRHQKNLSLFLISSALYRDGLNTLFAVGGLYAAGRYGMDFEDILIFAIGLNITAGLGAAAFAYIDDTKGSKATISLALIGLIGIGIAILWVDDKNVFLGLALFLGIFMGPAQAASRTLAGRLAMPEHITAVYGLYALTGKSIAFTGPLLYGFLTDLFNTQQAGMVSIISFWIIGLLLLRRVKE